MIDLYYWPTPNGHKITMMLEETGLPYRLIPVNLMKGEQLSPEFRKISPNGRMPAIIDHDPGRGVDQLSIFESGAILIYLSEKSGRFLPSDLTAKSEALQWLFWQVGGLGPMVGQNAHFALYAEERIPYAVNRYRKETERLFEVLDHWLQDRQFVAGAEYSIADMAIYPWIACHEYVDQAVAHLEELCRWMGNVESRVATKAAYRIASEINPTFSQPPAFTKEAREILFSTDERG